VGLSLAAASAPLMLALSWLQAKYPEYGAQVAKNDLATLDAIAARATRLAFCVCCLLMVMLLVMVVWLGVAYPEVAERFLSPAGVAALCAANLSYLLYQAMAGHLRAHREETLLWPIVIGSGAAIAATVTAAPRGSDAAAFAYSAAAVGVLLPLSVAAFLHRRHELHVG
jgi:hypothetical protein